MLHLLLLLVLLAVHLYQLFYFQLFIAELSSLRFSSLMVPMYMFFHGNEQRCLGSFCRDLLCIPSIF